MKLTIKRFQNGKNYDETFDIASLKVTTLLSALYEIKAKLDPTMTFEAGCRSGICGACAVRVNGLEVLACSCTPVDGDTVEPLQYHRVLRDLKIDRSSTPEMLKTLLLPQSNDKTVEKPASQKHRSAKTAGNQDTKLSFRSVSIEDEEHFRLQSDCILCESCYSACPVLAVNPEFLGPFALTRTLRYLKDPRIQHRRSPQNSASATSHPVLLDRVQENGIWDCTLCGECTAVCPQHIDPKSDIMKLRSESIKAGYSDPNFLSMDFGSGFGFDPN